MERRLSIHVRQLREDRQQATVPHTTYLYHTHTTELKTIKWRNGEWRTKQNLESTLSYNQMSLHVLKSSWKHRDVAAPRLNVPSQDTWKRSQHLADVNVIRLGTLPRSIWKCGKTCNCMHTEIAPKLCRYCWGLSSAGVGVLQGMNQWEKCILD